VETNTIFVGQGKDHAGLYRRGLFIKTDETHWIRTDLKLKEGETLEVMGRIRYRQPLEPATLYQRADGLYMIFDNPQSAISAGQFAAWYHDAECLGSGVIA
jgi:tRNA-specific 2-thiouridylase